MFQEFYGFSRLPFSKTIPTSDLFVTEAQKELNARLIYMLREQGFGLVTGEIGSGKSTAVRAFTASLDFNRHLVIYLSNPTSGLTGLYRDLLIHLGHQPPFGQARMVAEIRLAFEDALVNKRRAPLLIIDEAHLLSQTALEQLRLLFSDKMDSHSLASLLLLGPPELRRTLNLTVHEAFNQRFAVRYHLSPFNLQETLGYIKHHTRVAGFTAGPLFTDDAISRIFDYTKGIPRRINQVCTMALMAGLISKKTVLDESTVRQAIADIEHD